MVFILFLASHYLLRSPVIHYFGLCPQADPKTMRAAENASYVVGLKAKGTMTKTSKLAFVSQKEAEEFAGTCGGEVMDFQKTFKLAKKSLKK